MLKTRYLDIYILISWRSRYHANWWQHTCADVLQFVVNFGHLFANNFLFCRVCKAPPSIRAEPSMSMMDPNLLADAAQFGGPQSPLDIKPDVGASLLTTVSSGNIFSAAVKYF